MHGGWKVPSSSRYMDGCALALGFGTERVLKASSILTTEFTWGWFLCSIEIPVCGSEPAGALETDVVSIRNHANGDHASGHGGSRTQ